MEKLITTIPKNSVEEVRVGLTEYNGHDLFYARLYWKDDSNVWRPTKKGITLKVDCLPDVVRALSAAMKEARKAGVLQE